MKKQVTLALDGKTKYRIILCSECSATERHAAAELAYFLEKISGARFPLHQDDVPETPKEIIVGAGKRTRGIIAPKELADLGPEGFIIKTSGGKLIIAGGRLRGTMYGVYTFLEDFLGCRWYSTLATRIPERKRIVLPEINLRSKPAFSIRDPYLFPCFDAGWGSRNKCYGVKFGFRLEGPRADEQTGGTAYFPTSYHSFQYLVPPSRYAAEHPEYFSLIDGRRRTEVFKSQLCLSNPAVLKIVTDEVLKLAQEKPDSVIPVSQNDAAGNCQCLECLTLDEEYGGASGTFVRFLNKVAEKVCRRYPNITIAAEAYNYTLKAPSKPVRPHPNVMLTFAPYGACCSHDENCSRNQRFFADLAGWTKICRRIHVWDYCTNFQNYLQPQANIFWMPKIVRAYRRYGVMGITMQGNFQGTGGEFAELRGWLFSKLFWNPDIDFEAALTDFLTGYYGPAGRFIRQYIDLTHEPYRNSPELHLGNTGAPVTELPFRREYLLKAHSLFDRAEEAVKKDRHFLHRVRTARLPLQNLTMRILPHSKEEQEKLLQGFFETMEAEGVEFSREGSVWLKGHSPLEKELRQEMSKSGLLQDFLVIGPFDNEKDGRNAGFSLVNPPEESLDLKAVYQGKDNREIRWRKIETNLDMLDLRKLYGEVKNAAAYCLTVFETSEDLSANLLLGITQNDGAVIRLNGKEIGRIEKSPHFEKDLHSVEVRLKKGRNELLFKVIQQDDGWGIMARFDREIPGFKSLV